MATNEWVFEYNGTTFVIPERMRGGLTRYKNSGICPGDFLLRVLENDLVGAVGKADDENIKNLPAYANYLYNHLPSNAWGSKKVVEHWIETKRGE